jgi:eukaryotic-like serine/threonine-protein kinase
MAQRLGRYEILRPIATGGMATVYLGRVTAAGGFERLVAVKLMHPHIAADPDFVGMFLDEARLAARIRHPNVVATHDVEQSPNGLFLVMDYIEGAPLHQLIQAVARRGQRFPLEVALRIFQDALAGLHAAHELTGPNRQVLGLVHRDVSPQNVLVGTDGVSRITDFGVAHAESRLTTTRGGNLKGKVAYLSPEQIVVGSVDRRSDVYAAGIVLWEMLACRRLFAAKNEGMALAQVLGGARTSPRDENPEVPAGISDACMRALATKPEGRYASALEFAEALEAAAERSGAAVASPRNVSAFIASLGIETAPRDSRPPVGETIPVAPILPPLPSLPPLAPLLAEHLEIPPSGTHAGASLTPLPTPRRGIKKGILGFLAFALLAAGVAIFLIPRLRQGAAVAAPPAALPAPETAAVEKVEQAGGDPGGAESAASARAEAPSPSAEAPSAADQADESDKAPTKKASRAQSARSAPQARERSGAKTPRASATSYNPAEL